MAQKRIQYVKTESGKEKQYIGSHSTIVDIDAIAGLNATNVQDALEEIKDLADTGGVTSVNGKTGAVTLKAGDVGLGSLTDDAQVKRSEMGVASGVATLDTSGKVPTSQLPSYVDDVLEYNNKSAFPTTGETGKIYVAKDTNITWRWSGSAYVEISASLALGETSSTAYAGDKGKANAAAIAELQEEMKDVNVKTADNIDRLSIGSLSEFDSVSVESNGISYASTGELGYGSEDDAFAEIDVGVFIPLVAGDNVSISAGTGNKTAVIDLKNTGVAAGTYSAVTVDAKGRVSAGGQLIEWGASGQTTPSVNLAVGGLFLELAE